MPGYGIALAYALVAAILAGLLTALLAGTSAGVVTSLLGGIFMLAVLTVAYLLATAPDQHRHSHSGAA